MSRRPRVPGTKLPAIFRREIATAGRPTEAFLRVIESLPIRRGQVWETSVAHDDGCPALTAGLIGVCSCGIVIVEVARRVA